MESKDLVDGCPSVIEEYLPKTAESLEEAGATVKLRLHQLCKNTIRVARWKQLRHP